MKDFTIPVYKEMLLAFQREDYSFFTFEDWCRNKTSGKYLILRHDVDKKAENSLVTARLEKELNIRSTYYFRITSSSNNPDIIKQIAALGHEIGYHYEDLAIAHGDKEKGITHFKKQLNYFRCFYPVATVCMHGSPTSKYDNRLLWEKYNYRDLNILGEPYLDFFKQEESNKIIYFTDTARMWDGDKYNVRDKSAGLFFPEKLHVHSTFDLIRWIKESDNQLPVMVTVHPQRWTSNKVDWYRELIGQTLKNKIKYIVIKK
jgi:hypothetical protein